jgi:hypothetical protein
MLLKSNKYYIVRVTVSCLIQHSKHLHYIICCLFGCTTMPTLSNQERDILENVIEYKMRVLIFSTTFV